MEKISHGSLERAVGYQQTDTTGCSKPDRQQKEQCKKVVERYVSCLSYENAKRMLGTAQRSKFEDGPD